MAGLLAAALATAAPGGAGQAAADSPHDGGAHGSDHDAGPDALHGSGHGSGHDAGPDGLHGSGHDGGEGAEPGRVGAVDDAFAVTVRRVPSEQSAGTGGSKGVSYEVTVRNRTDRAYPDAEIVQMLPSEAKPSDSQPLAHVEQDWMMWGASLDGYGRTTVRSTLAAADASERGGAGEEFRWDPVVCVRADQDAGFSGCGGVAREADRSAAEQGAAGPAANRGGASSDGKPVTGDAGSKAAPAAASAESDGPRQALMALVALGGGLLVTLWWRIRRSKRRTGDVG
ncbi:hypothetical protein ACFQVC_07120 [Streptomyces monticola]|uniref:DUF11 domain-containing protein n=1 Tax=Streptomyces monticola TaxID=2666263 RepID=A0ABW2JER4_9ACTN